MSSGAAMNEKRKSVHDRDRQRASISISTFLMGSALDWAGVTSANASEADRKFREEAGDAEVDPGESTPTEANGADVGTLASARVRSLRHH
jgi:hypothetical protein